MEVKMNEGRLAVLMTVYNRETDYIRKAIEGVLNQTLKDFDFYIVNNGSTDPRCEKTILEFDDPRIHYVKIKDNLIKEKDYSEFVKILPEFGETEYVVWTHDDDIMKPRMLEVEKNKLDSNKHIGFVSVMADVIDEKENIIGEMTNIPADIMYKQNEYIAACCNDYNNYVILCPTIMFRRKYFKKAITEIINSKYEVYASYDFLYELWINSFDCDIYIMKEKLYQYRMHKNQGSYKYLMDIYLYNRDVIGKVLIEMSKKNNMIPYPDNFLKQMSEICEKLERRNSLEIILKEEVYEKDIEEIAQRCILFQKKWRKQGVNLRENLYIKIAYLKIKDIQEYYIWGTGSAADKTKMIIEDIIPEVKLIGYIDRKRTGEKNGIKIYSPEKIEYTNEKYIVVSATVIEKEVDRFLVAKGLRRGENFLPNFY